MQWVQIGFLGKLCFVKRIKSVSRVYASTRIRTSDHLLKRELLYHLSYGGIYFIPGSVGNFNLFFKNLLP